MIRAPRREAGRIDGRYTRWHLPIVTQAELLASRTAPSASLEAVPMNTTPSSTIIRAAHHRALVLGGGGSTGNAWLIGVVAGLFDAELDVTTADRTVGTSAGSTAAAQLAGSTPTELLAAILATTPEQRAEPVKADRGSAPNKAVADHLARTSTIIAAAENLADMRRRIGAAALDMDATSDGARQEQWRATVAARLASHRWPHRTLLVTAVEAHTGEPVVFDRHSGVDLVDAVAASCAGGFAYRIGDKRYIDGGYRSNADNADLATGCGRVLVLSPFGGRSRTPAAWGVHLAAQVDELRARGSSVETIFPDSGAEHMFGAAAMDLSLRPPAARAGYRQGTALAERLAAFWR